MNILGRLALLFVVVPIVELMLLIELGQYIGLLPTLGLVMLTDADELFGDPYYSALVAGIGQGEQRAGAGFDVGRTVGCRQDPGAGEHGVPA
ncbi:MAG: FxsA family protein, partial [Longimicrobiales bacterium]